MMKSTKEIGKICKRFREDKGMTQLEFSKATGISKDNISKFENGLNRNYYILLSYIELGLDKEVLFDGEEKESIL